MTLHRNPPGTAVDCKSCGQLMVWAISEKGKPIPFDVTPSDRGTYFLFRRPDKIEAIYSDGRHPSAVKARARGDRRFVAHWSTCPHADKHRTQK